MQNKAGISKTGFGLLTLSVILILVSAGMAQENAESYKIGASDQLEVNFWQQPDLNSVCRVSENGMITLPVVGEIKAAGLTTAQLAKNIVDQMAFYQTPVSQATVTVTEFNSRTVVVTGQVVTPGSQSFERIPDIWRVILNAGGPTDQADLARVTVVRREGDKSRVINVDLLSLIKNGDFSQAPPLETGDLINVPLSNFGVGSQLGETSEFHGRNVYFVLGSVITPGVRNLDAEIDVLDAITLAGGTAEDADLKNVRVIMKGPRYSKIAKINLKKYIEEGAPPRFIVHPEDTIYVPRHENGLFGSVLQTVSDVLPLLTAAGTIILLTR